MAITDTKKDLKLGEAVDTLLQNADDNFTSLFDTVDDLNEAIPTKTSELTNDSGFISGENGKAADSAKLDGKLGSYYLNYNNLKNKPTKLSDFTNDGGFINKDVDDLTNYTVKTETGTDIDVLLNSKDQKLTISLKNIDGTVISSKEVDFPIEQLVMSVEYVEADKDLKITLQNGTVTKVPLDAIIDGLVSNTRKINGKALSSDITLTQDDIASGSTYKRVKSGGDVTIGSDGVMTVKSIGGKTADEIGMVKDVQVNGTSVLDPNSGIANISIEIDDLGSEFTEVTASASKAINGTTYYGFNITNATEDVSLEVYNSAGQQIVVQKVRNTTNNTIFVACSTTSGGTYYVRKLSGGAIGGGTGANMDLLRAIAEGVPQVSDSSRVSVPYTATTPSDDGGYIIKSETVTINAPDYYIFTEVTANVLSGVPTGATAEASAEISDDGKIISFGLTGSLKTSTGGLTPACTISYVAKRKLSF